jgi:hypothetical protein
VVKLGHLKGFTTLSAVLRVDVEAENAYYVKWSASGWGGEMMLADDLVGAKAGQCSTKCFIVVAS